VERIARRIGDSRDIGAHQDPVDLTGAALTTTSEVHFSSQNSWKSEKGTICAMHASRTIVAGVVACFLFRPVVAIARREVSNCLFDPSQSFKPVLRYDGRNVSVTSDTASRDPVRWVCDIETKEKKLDVLVFGTLG
jgi:hypothetical protein